MEADIKQALSEIRNELKAHANASIDRQQMVIDEINKLSGSVREAHTKADNALAEVLLVKTATSRASLDLEGTDHSILAELNSVKGILKETQTHIAEEQKKEKRARRAWRVAQPTIIAALTVLANQLIAPANALQSAPKVNVTVEDAGK